MKLEDLHRMISFELKRGTALDAMIPLYVKQAVNFLERGHPLKYMEEWVQINLAAGDQVVDMVWAFRNFRFLRRDSEGKWLYLAKKDSMDEVHSGGIDDGTGHDQMLNAYSQIGMRYVRFNVKWQGQANLYLEGIIYKMSDWQTSRPDYRHFLLEQASDLLIYQTMMRIGASIRDPRLVEGYKPLRDEALQTLMNMDQDAEYAGRVDSMYYGGIYN